MLTDEDRQERHVAETDHEVSSEAVNFAAFAPPSIALVGVSNILREAEAVNENACE